jgi:hypothetical protein
MSPRLVPAGNDAVGRSETPVHVTVDGTPLEGVRGQTIAGVLLAAGRRSWRAAPSGAPRGVFCGIGVCFDCLVTVNGVRDVRACRRRAQDGDEITTQSRATAPGSGSSATGRPGPEQGGGDRDGDDRVPGRDRGRAGRSADRPAGGARDAEAGEA